MKKNLAQTFGMLVIIFALSSGMSFSQSIKGPVSLKHLKEHFSNIYKIDPRLVSGDFYQTPRISNSIGNPFFIDPAWKLGSVILDGVKFDSLPLRYDIVVDELILNTRNITSSYLQLSLKINNISSFNMGDHNFRPFSGSHTSDNRIFCEVLVQGEIDFLMVKSKRLTVAAGGIEDLVYQTTESKYILFNENLVKYRGRRTLMKLLPNHKAEIRDYLKLEKLRYRRLILMEHIELIAYCNVLLYKYI